MKFEFKKASRKKSKLRLLVSGLSGSGKTYSSLLISSGIGKKIAVIDTERGSASLYSDLIDFDVLDLPNFQVETYIAAIKHAAKLGYEVVIIDSITHAWDKIKEEADKNKKGQNGISGWAVATPLYKRFVDEIVSCPTHIIATTRVKTEWVMEEYEESGRKKVRPVRIGLAQEQKAGIESEFTLAMSLDSENSATFIKDRTQKFLGKTIQKPGVEFGEELLEWLNEGEEVILATDQQLKRFDELVSELKIAPERVASGLEMKGFSSKEQLTEKAVSDWIYSMEETVRNRQNKVDSLANNEQPSKQPNEV